MAAQRARRACARTSGPSAIGSSSLTRPPPRVTVVAVGRARPQQLAVRAGRGDASVLDQDDAVGLVEHERARRHDDRRPARARASRSRRAIRASVCASTALVGSTRTRISASASSARASTSRCRWPPESERPRSSTWPSEPFRQRVEHVLRVRDRDRREHAARPRRGPTGRARPRSGPEKSIGSVSLTTIAAPHRLERAASRAGTPPSSDAVVVDEAAEPVGDARRLRRGSAETTAREQPGLDHEAGARVRRAVRPAAARRTGAPGSATCGSIRRIVQHPLRADVARA